MGGKLKVRDIGKPLLHQLRHHAAQVRDLQVLALLDDVLPIDDRRHGGGVSGRPADALFLHGTDERCVGVVGGGLSEMLVPVEFLQRQRLPLSQRGQGGFLFLFLLVFALFIDGGIAREFQARRGGAENVLPRRNVHGYAVVHGVFHLAGQKTAPDQFVQSVLFSGQIALHLLRRQCNATGADRLVGILCIGLGLVVPGLGGVVILAVPAQNKALGGGERLLADAQGVRSHIGNEAHGALTRNVHALIELLGDGHGPPGGHAQLSGRVLLERGGGKRRGGTALLVCPLHGRNGKRLISGSLHHGFYLFGGLQLRLFAVFSVVVGGKFRLFRVIAPENGVQRPVFLRLESLDLPLPVVHHPGCHGLHPSGG
ncbi:hypothetical protein SDC9_122090 [bioreactor metagenome]|uniref:Uncharacterized protein n=1 Tax=bioreactor metagenome TaxID=1076179 RepID=A0A645CDT3_9ZZZZ